MSGDYGLLSDLHDLKDSGFKSTWRKSAGTW